MKLKYNSANMSKMKFYGA